MSSCHRPAGRALVAGMCLSAPFYPVPLSRCPSPPAIAGGVEIEDEESQSVDQAIDLHGAGAPMRPIWQGLKLVVAVWC
jgi:hypothetical protein